MKLMLLMRILTPENEDLQSLSQSLDRLNVVGQTFC